MSARKLKATHPICEGVGHPDAAHLHVLDSTCSICGWYDSSRLQRQS